MRKKSVKNTHDVGALFADLFVLPYERERWLKDQEAFIKRLRELKDNTIDTDNLQAMQDAKQCSILIPEIYKGKLALDK